MPHPLYDFGGSGPVIHLSLANGFPPETYKPLLAPLTDRYHVVAVLPRPLWPDPPPPGSIDSWRDMAADLLAGLRAHDLTDVIAVGHSMGGVFALLAAIEEPARFKGLALLDPTILPPLLMALMQGLQTLGLEELFPLVGKARQRRAHFPDEQAAFDYWRGKSLFADWDDEVLWHYVVGLTEPDPAGDGLRLAWPPAWEARIYATILTGTWREVPRLRGLLPTLVMRGSDTNTFRAASERHMRRLLPDATYVTLAGHGHLFPQSAPDRARRALRDWLATLP